MSAYYNEIDPYCARWLNNLVLEGVIAHGDVDTRSIEDVTPGDLAGYTQCHFFAGIGCWSYALRLAGWPDTRAVWTGSCPCQPFSAAGKGGGVTDERHLWPAWFHLIELCRPSVLFGEQVASPAALGWLDLVQTDMEGTGYALGAVDLCAASAAAAHIRQRLYWVADTTVRIVGTQQRQSESGNERQESVGGRSVLSELGVPNSAGRQPGLETGSAVGYRNAVEPAGGSGGLANDDGTRLEVRQTNKQHSDAQPESVAHCDFIWCRDGRFRPVEPGTFPLAHRAPARMGRLRAYGNAVHSPLAAQFVRAYLEC